MLITTSRHTILNGPEPRERIVAALSELAKTATIAVVSNLPEPHWFEECFGDSNVQFAQWKRRQGGDSIREFAEEHGLPSHEVVVFAGSQDDIAMARNGNALLVTARWASEKYVSSTGVCVRSGSQLVRVMELLEGWSGESWFRATCGGYSVEAICDISTFYKNDEQRHFGEAVRDVVKEDGGPLLNSLLAVTSCVLVAGGINDKKKQMWGLYPSSSSSNDDTDTLSDFTHRLRTSVSSFHMARRDSPLFKRHTDAVKRSRDRSVDRTDPTSEIESLHLNPDYQGKIAGRNIVVLDDCTTYGISMAVAAGLLRKAGAKSVTCLALGKLGRCFECYDLKVTSDPFRPVGPGHWSCSTTSSTVEGEFNGTQRALRKLLNVQG